MTWDPTTTSQPQASSSITVTVSNGNTHVGAESGNHPLGSTQMSTQSYLATLCGWKKRSQ